MIIQCAGITRSMASQPTSVNRLVLTYSGKSLAAMNSSDQKQGHLFHIDDKSSGLRFLVDTGAEVGVIPPSQADRKCPQKNFTLQAVNNTFNTTNGSQSLTSNLGLHRTFRWIFIFTRPTSNSGYRLPAQLQLSG